MSFTAGILALAVWLCPNEASENGFPLFQIWCSEAKEKCVDKDQDGSLNEPKLENSLFVYADKNLVIRYNNLLNPMISGLFSFPSGQCCSAVKLLHLST